MWIESDSVGIGVGTNGFRTFFRMFSSSCTIGAIDEDDEDDEDANEEEDDELCLLSSFCKGNVKRTIFY